MKALVFMLAIAVPSFANNAALRPPDLKGIGIEQKLNAQVPLDTMFRDETGAAVSLSKYFGRRAVLLAPVYYTCPNLCSQILSGMVSGLRPLSLTPGRDFDIVAISFDPSDKPEVAGAKRDKYVHSYSHKATTAGWHFLTGDQKSITAVMNAIGFHYRWDDKNKMFVHASGLMILTPDGHVARYLYGVDYEPKDLKLGLVEASNRKIGSPVDQILLFCYHYDPATGKYGLVVLNTLRGAAVLTLVVLGAGLAWLWRRDLRTYHVEEPKSV
jgi:protein SCO1/2